MKEKRLLGLVMLTSAIVVWVLCFCYGYKVGYERSRKVVGIVEMRGKIEREIQMGNSLWENDYDYGYEIVGMASWYSQESCRKEGTSGIMANGDILDDTSYTCASWDFEFGTILKITHMGNSKSVEVVVTDRGPNKKLYESGRIIDLSVVAFSELDNLNVGVIKVKVERI